MKMKIKFSGKFFPGFFGYKKFKILTILFLCFSEKEPKWNFQKAVT
jgi:hypothetical protein